MNSYEFDYAFDAQELEAKCQKRKWSLICILAFAKFLNAIKVVNPSAPLCKRKLSYRGHGAHWGNGRTKRNKYTRWSRCNG